MCGTWIFNFPNDIDYFAVMWFPEKINCKWKKKREVDWLLRSRNCQFFVDAVICL